MGLEYSSLLYPQNFLLWTLMISKWKNWRGENWIGRKGKGDNEIVNPEREILLSHHSSLSLFSEWCSRVELFLLNFCKIFAKRFFQNRVEPDSFYKSVKRKSGFDLIQNRIQEKNNKRESRNTNSIFEPFFTIHYIMMSPFIRSLRRSLNEEIEASFSNIEIRNGLLIERK